MPLMTRINGRPVMLTFTPIPLTNQTEVREVFSDNAYRVFAGEDYPPKAYYMATLMTWPEYGWDVRICAPIRNLECRGPRDRVSGPSILAQAWDKEWGVP